MKSVLTILVVAFLSLKCFSQKTATLEETTEGMKGFWMSTDKSSSHCDSLYFGDNGIFYEAHYHPATDTIKGYTHQVGRWIIEERSGSMILKVSCASVEYQGNFAHYDTQLILSKSFFFLGEKWVKQR